MANEFASTDNPETQGILKDYYESSPVSDALKRKRKKLAETKLGTDQNESPKEGD